ncbi:hypothetical protein R5R35_002724 [Gryllus longicercus]|uniref:DUF4795 domain-containing protein n=1 Tax=Gryllus longicercus TaxID=2509291 RepID=A0AAN9VFT1_9ORTH
MYVVKAPRSVPQVLAGGVAAWELWAAGGAPPDELQLQLADSARVRVLEARVDEVREHVRTLQEQADDTERELGLLAERATTATAGRGGGGGAGGDTQGELAGLTELFNKIHLMQCDVEAISNACSKLMEERDRRSLQLVQLAAQLDALRTAKADREEVDEALQAKADQLAVNRKVSHEQLDTALEELARGLQEAVSKLAQQEQLWQQALEEMQTEIGSKLDSQELAPLKEFVNKKLRTLHERLKNLAKVRKQAEAAGTKRKLLRDATCVSCDAEVVMATEEEAAVPRPPPLPPPRSARPYLTYELDMIRRQQQQAGSAKNLLHLEAALVEDDRRAKTSPAHSHSHVGKGEHVCSRYCGGSHTVTSAFQRVVRKGHFALQEAGPECSQLLPERGPTKPNGKPHSAPQPQTQPQSQTQPKPESGDAANKKK